MLAGFPKTITTTKLGRGHYLIERDDGHCVEVRRGVGGWIVGNGGLRADTLNQIKFDLRHGYTAHDQVEADFSLAAWERAMGMSGYAGSPAEREDRRALGED